jgi:uncharacterized repeat protein (TIGR02543 family)
VPTISEWNDVIDYWTTTNWGMNISNFANALKLPLPWSLSRSYGNYYGTSYGNEWYYWSTSTSNVSSQPSYVLQITSTWYDSHHPENRANWYSVRCFKDDDTIYTITYNDWINNDEIFADQVGTGMRWDYLPSFVWWHPEWNGDDDRYFIWWYMENNWEYTYVDTLNKQITSDITLYAKWSICEEWECVVPPDEIIVAYDLDVYFAVNDNNTDHYTLMDRNIWAKRYWTWANSYGLLFQWWNNYWFSNTWYLPNKSKHTVNVSQNWPGNYYYSSTFIYNNNDWASSHNNNLWWDTTNTVEARRWPCPDWYHVPSSWEWLSLYNSWYSINWDLVCSTVSSCIEKIKNDLLLPAVGRIDEKGKIWLQDASSYWSSSYSNSKGWTQAYWFYLRAADREKQIQPNNEDYRARGRSVRCVKDIENTPLIIDLTWWVLWSVSIYDWKLHYLTDPTKTGFTFAWWYTNSALTTKIEDGANMDGSITVLYAKWNEADEVEYVFQANGWLFQVEDSGNIIKSEVYVQTYTQWDNFDLSQLEAPTRECHTFAGRYDAVQGGNEIQFPTIVSSPITAYAHWTVWDCIITTDVVGGGNIIISPDVWPYAYGSTVIFTAAPWVWNVFDKWMKNWEEILSGWNSTLVLSLTWDIHLTGYFLSSSVPQHIVSILSNNAEYGSVSESSLIVDDGTLIDISGNVLTIWSTVVVAIPSSGTEQYSYIFTWWNNTCGYSVTGDCSIIAWFQRKLNEFTVTWQNYDGDVLEIDTGVEYGTIPQYDWQTPEKDSDEEYNYVFIWWIPELTWITEDTFYTAVFSGEEIWCDIWYHEENWECTGNTKYVPCTLEWAPTHATYSWEDVLIYWDGTGRSIPERCIWSCDENYHEDSGDCVLDTYTLSFDTSGWVAVASKIVEYSSVVTLPWTTKIGYQFSWWYNQLWEFVWVSGTNFVYDMTWNTVLYAKWIANTGTHYTVKHWLQNADDDLYTESIADRETLQWTTDTLTNAVANYYTWFETWEVTQLTISWDETTVVNVYYDREVYTINIDLNWWTWVGEITWKYGQTLVPPEISKSWYTLKKYIPNLPTTMPLNWTSVRVVWTLINWWVSISIVPITWTDFNFGSVVSSNRVQILTGYLWENSFQLEDSRWENSGYYVTLSISSLNSVNTSNSISSSNIQLKSHWISTISWTPAQDVWIQPQITTWTTMSGTVVYLTRPDISVEDDPLVGRYGDNLEFKVTVPPYTYSDRYKAVITYTLYDND